MDMPEEADRSNARPRETGGVSVITELESPRGWVFAVRVPGPVGAAGDVSGGGSGMAAAQVDLSLSWADYEYWSHGSASPSRIAEAVVRTLREAEPERILPAKFDASTARRWVTDFDDRMQAFL